MRTSILLVFYAMSGQIATAQLKLTPQVGVEDFKTSAKYNGLSSASGMCLNPAAQAALKLEYLFKKNHGPWMAAATSRSTMDYSFADPETGGSIFQSAAGNTQLRLEAGYQVKTKRLFFKPRSANQSKASSYRGHCQDKIVESRCGSKATALKKAAGPRGAWMRIAPSAGLAYIPGGPASAITSKTSGSQTTYAYNAGNWRTAVVGGIGFEFGKNNRDVMSVSLNHLRAFGNALDAKRITTVEGNKTTNTSLQSTASAWSLRLGIPLSITRKKAVKEKIVEKIYIREVKKCGETKMQYKPRCYKTYQDQ